MRQFIGRQPQLQAFANRLGLAEGGLLRFTGQAGIGKSRLLREFRAHCEREGRPYLWLNLENATEIPDGMQILFELGRSAHGFPEARRAALRQQGESAGDALNRYDKTLDQLANTAKLVDPSGGALTAIARTAVRLAQDIAGPRAGEDIDGAIENSEHYLLNILATAGPHHPVCLLDTYEHLLASRQSFNSRVEFDGGKAREGIAREIKLAQWMRQLTDFLVANGWIVVIAGRYLIGERDEDRLPRLGRADIASAIDANPAFADWLPDHRETLLDLLTDLSFDGNPLWLSIAINLLERQLADGDTPERLRDDPGYLRRCFERTDPDDDLAALEGVEHSACKLHLLEHLTRDCPGLEEQGWRIALPRVLDQGILRCLYPREQADALLRHYRLAGAFDQAGRNGYRLHEEIRDLLLAYARGKGYLQAPETRRLHCKILQYLFDRHDFDPDELLDVGFGDQQLNKRYPDAENPWLLEATYHAVQVKSELQRHGVTNEAFWDLLGGSASCSGIDKLWVAIHPLEHALVRSLIEGFRKEADQLSKLLGSSSTQALREALRSGAAKHLYDLGFWRRRVDNFGLAGDHFGLAVSYAKVGSDEDEIAVYDALLARFADHDAPVIQAQCAMAMFNKGVTLGQLQRPEDKIAVFDALLARFGDHDAPEIQTLCAQAMFSKGGTLGQLQRAEEAIAAFDALLARFGDHDDPEIQTQCQSARADSAELLLAAGQPDAGPNRAGIGERRAAGPGIGDHGVSSLADPER